ncbi:MAG: hypothetical protein A2539_03825 [Elusimicrobia bacterium RIFOXYD2_FULL_34_15]|nr:MAG: hypothetical protein A2539_03825 [Elusimicrobia bacterium RIFOXYD2_FULL_34_15]
MFDKLKQLKQLKDLQSMLSQERVEVEKDGVKVVINGKLEVESVQVNPALDKEKQEKILKDCFNDAIKRINFSIAQKMAKIPGMGL